MTNDVTKVGMVTHIICEGMLFHVQGNRQEVLNMIGLRSRVPAGGIMYDLPVVDNDGKVNDISVSVYSSILVLDDHEFEAREVAGLSGMDLGSAGEMKI